MGLPALACGLTKICHCSFYYKKPCALLQGASASFAGFLRRIFAGRGGANGGRGRGGRTAGAGPGVDGGRCGAGGAGQAAKGVARGAAVPDAPRGLGQGGDAARE